MDVPKIEDIVARTDILENIGGIYLDGDPKSNVWGLANGLVFVPVWPRNDRNTDGRAPKGISPNPRHRPYRTRYPPLSNFIPAHPKHTLSSIIIISFIPSTSSGSNKRLK